MANRSVENFQRGGLGEAALPKRKRRVGQRSIGRVGPLGPSPAHPIQSLRDGLVSRLRGGIAETARPYRAGNFEMGRPLLIKVAPLLSEVAYRA